MLRGQHDYALVQPQALPHPIAEHEAAVKNRYLGLEEGDETEGRRGESKRWCGVSRDTC